jgi:hypothetical protein
MIKTQILDNLLMEWFTKSLLPTISKDVAMVQVATEEQAIMHAQHLDLIYSQLGTLYDIIPHAPRSSTDPKKPNPGPHVDGVVGSVSHASVNQLADHMGHMSISSHPSATSSSAQTSTVPTQTSKVNSVQSTQPKNPQQPGGKKKRNKKKNSNTEKGTVPTQNTQEGGTKEKKKSQFPCMICGEDHPTHQCPQKDEVHIFLAQQKAPPTTYCLNSSFSPSTSTYGCNKSYPSARGHGRYPSP